jgi:type IV pilus assembly protein PilA
MQAHSPHRRPHQRGQGMVEYIIIVALIAVAAIALFGYFGQTVRNQGAGLAQEIAGATNSGQAAANTSAGQAATEANAGTGMANYTNQSARITGGGGAPAPAP